MLRQLRDSSLSGRTVRLRSVAAGSRSYSFVCFVVIRFVQRFAGYSIPSARCLARINSVWVR
jgi:hypothetical protein